MRMLGMSLTLLVLFVLSPVPAAETRPVLIVTVSSVESLLSDVNYLATATGNEQYGQMAGAIAQGYIQGLDNSRPISIVVQSDGAEVKPLGMLPIKDLDQFLAGLAQQLGEPQDAGNGVLELAGPAPMFVKEQGGWAFISPDASDLKELPADPTSLMAGMEKKYDVAVRGYIQNIPRNYRDMALEQIKEGVKRKWTSCRKTVTTPNSKGNWSRTRCDNGSRFSMKSTNCKSAGTPIRKTNDWFSIPKSWPLPALEPPGKWPAFVMPKQTTPDLSGRSCRLFPFIWPDATTGHRSVPCHDANAQSKSHERNWRCRRIAQRRST